MFDSAIGPVFIDFSAAMHCVFELLLPFPELLPSGWLTSRISFTCALGSRRIPIARVIIF